MFLPTQNIKSRVGKLKSRGGGNLKRIRRYRAVSFSCPPFSEKVSAPLMYAFIFLI